MEYPATSTAAAMTSSIVTFEVRAGCCLAIARKVLTMRAQRSAALLILSARSAAFASAALSFIISDRPSTTDSGLFSSCATPASRPPSADIFSFWCSVSR